MSLQNVHRSRGKNAACTPVSVSLSFPLPKKKCFGRNLELLAVFSFFSVLLSFFLNRQKRLNELHVGGLLGGGKERAEWVSVERQEKEGGGVRNQ